MSCENPSDTVETLMPRRRKFDKTGICIKCKTTPGRLVIRHAVYCKACFIVLVTSKFRQVLNPTINFSDTKPQRRGSLKAPGNLMIGFSGGLGSTVLLDLVKTCYFTHMDARMSKGGKEHPRKSGRAWGRAIVCFIDCSQGYDRGVDRTHDISFTLKPYEDFFEFVAVRLEDAFKISSGRKFEVDLSREDLPLLNDEQSDVSSTSLLKAYLSSLPTPTSYQNSITLLIRLLLQHTARTHGCSHLLLGTSLTSLSINLIDAVANGAGYTLAYEKDEDWPSPGSGVVRVVRPLREISMKECAAYLHWRNLSVIGNQRMLLAPTNNKDSIASRTKEFIFGLERDYPSTVSAIVRTCEKLTANTVGNKCVLCERPAQPGVQEWKERISIRNMGQADMPADVADSSLDKIASAITTKPNAHLTSSLCYACHTTLTSRSSRGARQVASIGDAIHNVPLPTWVGKNLSEANTTNRMKQQIQEFLIDTDIEDSDLEQNANV